MRNQGGDEREWIEFSKFKWIVHKPEAKDCRISVLKTRYPTAVTSAKIYMRRMGQCA